MTTSTKSDKRDILILNQKCAHTLSFYDVETGEELDHIRFANYPHEFVVDSRGETVYVGHYGILGSECVGDNGGSSVFVVDIKTRKHVHTLSTWPYYRIHGLGMDNKDRLFAMSEASNVLLRFSNPKSQTQADLGVPSGGLKTHLFSMKKDGEFAFSVNLLSNTVAKFKPNDAAFTPIAINTGQKPEGNCLSLDEKYLYITNRNDNNIVKIDTDTMQIVATANTGIDPNRVYLAPNGNLLVINYGDTFVSKFDDNLNEIGRIKTDNAPIAISFHPNSKFAYLSLQGDSLATVDLSKDEIIRSFKTRAEPDVSFLLSTDMQDK